MCGLVGVITKGKYGLRNEEVSAFTQLLYADQVRGSHGTGIFYNSRQGKPHIRTLKSPIPASSFINLKEYGEAANIMFKESNFVVGHNRSATKGQINTECTHPFREKHIVLVHNGTLFSHNKLKEGVEVDSHAICHSIAEIGVKETVKKIEGAFALIWFDSKEKTLNLCRNSKRPLYIIDFGICFVLCSELDLGLWVGGRNNLKVVKTLEVKTETLYKFSLDNLNTWTEEPLEYYTFDTNNYKHTGGQHESHGAVWAGYSQKVGKTRSRSYAFGEKIRFRSGKSIHTRGKVDYIEGDILKYQYLANGVVPKPDDFEDEFRLTIYGDREALGKLTNKDDLTGTVINFVIKGGVSYYTLSHVEESKTKRSNVTPLPSTPTPNSDKTLKCNWCGDEKETLFYKDGEYLCKDCSDYSVYPYGTFGGG